VNRVVAENLAQNWAGQGETLITVALVFDGLIRGEEFPIARGGVDGEIGEAVK